MVIVQRPALRSTVTRRDTPLTVLDEVDTLSPDPVALLDAVLLVPGPDEATVTLSVAGTIRSARVPSAAMCTSRH